VRAFRGFRPFRARLSGLSASTVFANHDLSVFGQWTTRVRVLSLRLLAEIRSPRHPWKPQSVQQLIHKQPRLCERECRLVGAMARKPLEPTCWRREAVRCKRSRCLAPLWRLLHGKQSRVLLVKIRPSGGPARAPRHRCHRQPRQCEAEPGPAHKNFPHGALRGWNRPGNAFGP
jgi:hypothetical protein